MKLILLLSILITTPLLAMDAAKSTKDFISWLDRRFAELGNLEEVLFFAEDLTQIEDYVQQLADPKEAKRIQKLIKALQESNLLPEHASRMNKLIILLHTKQHVNDQSKAKKAFSRKKPAVATASPSISTEILEAQSDLGMSKVYSQTLDENASKAITVQEALQAKALEIVLLTQSIDSIDAQTTMIETILLRYPDLSLTTRELLIEQQKQLLLDKTDAVEKLAQERVLYAQLEKDSESVQHAIEHTKSALIGRIDATSLQRQRIESAINMLTSDSTILVGKINTLQTQIDLLTTQLARNNQTLQGLIERLPELQSKQKEHRTYKKQLATINLKEAVSEGKLLPKPNDHAAQPKSDTDKS